MGIKHIVDYGVIAILAVMSIIAVAIAIERFSFFRKVNITEYKTLEILELELTRHFMLWVRVQEQMLMILWQVLPLHLKRLLLV